MWQKQTDLNLRQLSISCEPESWSVDAGSHRVHVNHGFDAFRIKICKAKVPMLAEREFHSDLCYLQSLCRKGSQLVLLSKKCSEVTSSSGVPSQVGKSRPENRAFLDNSL